MSEFSDVIRTLFSEADKERDKNLVELEGIDAYYDISYFLESEYNLLDVYRPQGVKRSLPVIVNIHGGAYVYGMKEVYKYYGMFMAKQGFVFINPNYHLAPERKFPVQLTDINQVLKWMVMYRGKYHMDLENVFLVGDSAGAQIASHFCTIYSNEKFAKEFDFQISKQVKIRAMALNCGMYDILSLAQDTGVEETTEFKDNKALMDEYLGEDYESKRKQLDLLNHITGQFPPTFLMTSYYDFLKEYAEPMYRLLTSRGVLTSYKIYGEEGQEHMGHVFHCNMNLKEAEQCNIDECNFFRKFIV